MLDTQKLAKQEFDKVLNTIDSLLTKNDQLNIDNLQKIYIKMKRKDQRVIGSLGLPLIGGIAQASLSHDFSKSNCIPKIAKLMYTLELTYIDREIAQKLKDQKNELYSKYFIEEYETDAKALKNQNEAIDCLYPLEQEK